jgi:hypothetical protein
MLALKVLETALDLFNPLAIPLQHLRTLPEVLPLSLHWNKTVQG